MTRKSKSRSKSSTLSKLKRTLTEIAFTSPALTYVEGEAYVCSVCQLPVKLCNADPTKRCASMRLEGTQLQLLRRAGKTQVAICIRCGGPIAPKTLKKNPLTELCPSCQISLTKSKSPKRSKGASL